MQISFTGDIAFGGYFGKQELNDNLLSPEVRDFLVQSDACVCNIEGPICSQKIRKGRGSLKSGPDIHHFLSLMNGNILFLGNNHILDYDEVGLQETLDFAAEKGYEVMGAGRNIKEASKPLIFGNLCGMLALRYYNKHARASESECGCLIWDEEKLIRDRISEIKHQCRWCILVVHGGDEFCTMPFPYIRNRYRKFLEWGADIIVAHHPHVVQGYEMLDGKAIFYSLGNFVFDNSYMRAFPETREGVLLKLDIKKDDFSWKYLPIIINGDSKTIKKGSCPCSFFCIAGDNDYYNRLPDVISDFLKKEKINLKFQMNRSIPIRVKCRIALSHIKRYLKEKKKLKKYMK